MNNESSIDGQCNEEHTNASLLGGEFEDSKEARGKWRKILTNPDTVVLLTSTAIHNYINCSCFMWLPMVIIERLHWSVKALGWVNMSVAITSVIPLLLLLRYRIGNYLLYRLGLFSQFSLIVCQSVIVVQYSIQNKTVNIIMWIIYCFMVVFVVIADEVFFVGVLAQMVSSEYQIFADGVRLTAYRIAGGIAFFAASYTLDNMFISSGVHIFLIFVSITLLIIRRRTLQNSSITLC